VVATPDTVRGTDQRRRVAAIGAGFGGLTATKALRHAEVNISDVVVFLVRITAQGTSYVVNQTPYGFRSSQRSPASQPLLARSSRYM
jgi:monoamine oxidase